jgi:hypothetical protein
VLGSGSAMACPVLELGHPLGREQRVEELAVLAVLGGVDLQRDQRPDLADGDRVHTRREHFVMAQDVADRLIRGDDRHRRRSVE